MSSPRSHCSHHHTRGAPNGQGIISSTWLLLPHHTYSYHRVFASGQDPSIRPVLLQFMRLPASTNDPVLSLNLELQSIHLHQLHKTGLGNDFMDITQQRPQVLQARQPVLLGVQHFLGGLRRNPLAPSRERPAPAGNRPLAGQGRLRLANNRRGSGSLSRGPLANRPLWPLPAPQPLQPPQRKL